MTDGDSEARLVRRLQAGDEGSVEFELWGRYFERLIGLTRARLRGSRGGDRDEEDVALSVFDSAFRRLKAGRAAWVTDRDSLWHLLVRLSRDKALDERRRRAAKKRGAVREADADADLPAWGDLFLDREPTPAEAAEFADDVASLLNQLAAPLRAVAVRKLEGYTDREIADQDLVVPRTVERRVATIRRVWSGETPGDA